MNLLYDQEMRVYWTLCGSDGNNAYLIVCPETAESIIIDAPLNPEAIIEQAQGTHVRAILITHRHRDHVEGLGPIVEATGALVAAHADDADGMPSPPDILLADGDTLQAGSLEVKAIHIPGHTPGSTCYLAGNHLFTGDSLYAGGPGETRGPEATMQILEGITRKLLVLPEDTFVLPGHGQGANIAAARRLYRHWVEQYPDLLPPMPEVPESH